MEGSKKDTAKSKDEVFKVDTNGMNFSEIVRKVANANPKKGDNAKRHRKNKNA